MVDLSFELLWNIDVLDPPAIDADEMVMMSREPFSQLISRRSLRGQVRDDDLRLLEHGQGPVQRRQWHSREFLRQLSCRPRTVGLIERLDD
jgi:hypothetical protein